MKVKKGFSLTVMLAVIVNVLLKLTYQTTGMISRAVVEGVIQPPFGMKMPAWNEWIISLHRWIQQASPLYALAFVIVLAVLLLARLLPPRQYGLALLAFFVLPVPFLWVEWLLLRRYAAFGPFSLLLHDTNFSVLRYAVLACAALYLVARWLIPLGMAHNKDKK